MNFYLIIYYLIVLSIVDVCFAETDTSTSASPTDCGEGFRSVDGKPCEMCKTCPPGQGVLVLCNNSDDTQCEQCGNGKYSTSNNSVETCLPCNNCTVEKSPCNPTRNTECECDGNFYDCDGLCKPCNSQLTETESSECEKEFVQSCKTVFSTDKMISEKSADKEGLPKVNPGVEIIFGGLLTLVLLAALMLFLYRFSNNFKKCIDTRCSFCAGPPPLVTVTTQVRYKRHRNEILTKETILDSKNTYENLKLVPVSEMVLTAISDKLALTDAQLRRFAMDNGIQDSRFDKLVHGVAYLSNRQYNVLHDWWMQNPHCMTIDLVESLGGISSEAASVARDAVTTNREPYQELQIQA